MDLFFGLFSEAGTWSAEEIGGWYKDAGLDPLKPKRMWFGPDLALHVGRKTGMTMVAAYFGLAWEPIKGKKPLNRRKP